MIQNKLDAFKAKANSVLLTDSLLHVTGGQTSDPDFCHIFEHTGEGDLDWGYRGKAVGFSYSQCQVDHFFANPNLAMQFNNMWVPGDLQLANQRYDFFVAHAGQPGGQ